jgi:hypothetical protein
MRLKLEGNRFDEAHIKNVLDDIDRDEDRQPAVSFIPQHFAVAQRQRPLGTHAARTEWRGGGRAGWLERARLTMASLLFACAEQRLEEASPTTLFMTEAGVEVLSRDDGSAKLEDLSVRAVLVPHLSRNGLAHAHGGILQSDVLVRATPSLA